MDKTNVPTSQPVVRTTQNAHGAPHVGIYRSNAWRHRAIGAAVVLGTALVVLPMLFATPDIAPKQSAQTQVPPVPKKPMATLELPVNQTVPQTKPVQVPGVAKDLSKAQTPTGEKAADVAPSGYRYFIQVLATSSETGAEREMTRFRTMGLPVYSVKVQKKAATLWRVRLGPFDTKADAARAVKVLDDAKISHMPLQSEKVAAAKAAATKPTAVSVKAATSQSSASAPKKAEVRDFVAEQIAKDRDQKR